MVLPRFQSVCLDLPNWGRGGGDKRVGRETRTPPAPENTDVKEKAACCSCPYNTSIVIIRGHVFMTRRRRCTCARESTRPSACEAATCAPTVREGGKIGRDEHPLDCSAEKHCGYLPPTRQPPSAPAKHNQRRIIPIFLQKSSFLQSNASKQPLENC